MTKTEEVVLHEFAGVRTAKASPSLVENIMVDAYGSQMRILRTGGNHDAGDANAPDSTLGATTLHPIEKAIQKSNLGLNPAMIRKPSASFPAGADQERRVEFSKIVRKMAEDGRVAIRHVRRMPSNT